MFASAATSVESLATISGQSAAVRVTTSSGGTIAVVGAGNYALSTAANSGQTFTCSVDEADSVDKNAYFLVAYVNVLLSDALAAAALFDLGARLAWVPKRLADGRYALVVTNNELNPVPLNISSRFGTVASVQEVCPAPHTLSLLSSLFSLSLSLSLFVPLCVSSVSLY